MSEKVYEKLREILDIHPMGCPPAPEIIEILKILFTGDEARVAVALGFRPFTVDEMIDQAKVVGIARCPCREFEQNCDAPREACMTFGATCTFLVERGFARY